MQVGAWISSSKTRKQDFFNPHYFDTQYNIMSTQIIMSRVYYSLLQQKS